MISTDFRKSQDDENGKRKNVDKAIRGYPPKVRFVYNWKVVTTAVADVSYKTETFVFVEQHSGMVIIVWHV